MQVFLAGTGLWIYLTPWIVGGGGIPNLNENVYGRNERRAIQVSNSDDIKRGYP